MMVDAQEDLESSTDHTRPTFTFVVAIRYRYKNFRIITDEGSRNNCVRNNYDDVSSSAYLRTSDLQGRPH